MLIDLADGIDPWQKKCDDENEKEVQDLLDEYLSPAVVAIDICWGENVNSL